MPDPVSGILTWRDRRALVAFPTRRGMSNPVPVPPGHLADELGTPQAEPREVELDLEGGQPRRVRPIGSAWRDAAASPQPATRHSTSALHGGDRQSGQPSQGGGMPGFHNPYGFLRTRDRGNVEGDLGDRRPESHSWYKPELWSGRIGVKLTVETPLLIPDAAEVETNKDSGHKTYPMRMAPDGVSPYLPPASVKGMLRAAYEAVTNSRLGVFTGHDQRLGFRMAATEGLALVPGRVDKGQIELLLGTNPSVPTSNDGRRWQVPSGIMYAAWLPRYRREDRSNIRYPDRSLPRHGDAVRFWAEMIRHCSGRFSFWEVRSNSRMANARLPAPGARVGGEVREFTGWVCVTNQNINRKHDERVFFTDPKAARPPSFPVTTELESAWRDLVREYRLLHQGEIDRRRERGERPDQYLGHEPGKTGFSRHVYHPEDQELTDGALVYVRLDSKGTPIGVYPVMISRELHPNAPSDLLEKSLRPAETIDQMSPADRVFGWVRQKEGQKGLGAYRGNLRVGPITCETADAVQRFAAPLPLAILGQPKPNQARFYLVPRSGTSLSGQGVQGAYDTKANRLQGRKAYPHHAKLAPGHWNDAASDNTPSPRADGTFKEYRRAGGVTDDQNRSVKGWVRPGSVFTFDIHVTNLSAVELGALLWLLSLGSGGDNRPRFHRLGGGKPLGFGSVRLEVTGNNLALGATLAERYRDFNLGEAPDVDAAMLGKLNGKFRKAVKATCRSDHFAKVPFIADFLVAAEGFQDNRPIHYPRVTPGPSVDGENFKWFQENERGPKAGLAPPADDRGLPFYSENQNRS